MRVFDALKIPEKASVTRRAVLTGGVALSVAALPAAAGAGGGGDNYDELVFKLDLRDEWVEQHEAAITRFEAIDRAPDQPAKRARIELASFFEREHVERHFPFHRLHVFTVDDDRPSFHDFFEGQIEAALRRAACRPDCADRPLVLAQDYAKVTSAMHQQLQRRQYWEEESGYLAAEAELLRVLDELCDLEQQIYDLPVRSFRDMRVKLDIVESERWLFDEDKMRSLLRSIGHFAGREGGAA